MPNIIIIQLSYFKKAKKINLMSIFLLVTLINFNLYSCYSIDLN